jgi:hypothetical protein
VDNLDVSLVQTTSNNWMQTCFRFTPSEAQPSVARWGHLVRVRRGALAEILCRSHSRYSSGPRHGVQHITLELCDRLYIYIFIIVLLPQLLLLLLLSLLCYFFIIFQMFLTDIRYCGSWKARSGRHEKEGLIAAVARLLHSNIASRQTEALLRTCKPSFLPVARRPSLIAVAPRDCW